MNTTITYAPCEDRSPSQLTSTSKATEGAIDRLAYMALWVFVFCIPWADNIPVMAGFAVGRWVGLVAVGIGLLRLAVTRRIRRPSVAHYGMCAFVAWSALSILWSIDVDSTISRVGTYLQLLVAMWLIWELTVDETRILGLLQSYVLGTSVSIVLTLVNFSAGRTAAAVFYEQTGQHKWETTRFTIAGINENDLGLMLVLSLPMTLYLLLRQKGPVKVLYWLQIPACITVILLTGSRGSLAAGAVALAMYPLTVFRLPRMQRLVSIIACAAVLTGGSLVVPKDTWLRLLSFGTEMSEGTLTHRTVIWSAGLEAFRDHAFAGVGAGAYGPAVMSVINIPYVAHNTYLSVLVELGCIGGLLFVGLLATIGYCAWRMKVLERRLWLTLLLSWGIGAFALTWEYHKPTWLLFGLVVAHAYSRRGPQRLGFATPGTISGFQELPERFSTPSSLVPSLATSRRRSFDSAKWRAH